MGRIGVLFVCYGNICRSPMAEFVFRKILDEEGLSDRFYVESAATSGEHIGDPVDPRAAAELRMHGMAPDAKRGRRLKRSDYTDFDYVVGMDRHNMEYIRWTAPAEPTCEMSMLLDWAGGGEVSDPYYTGDFDRTYLDVSRGCRALLDHILEDHPEVRA